MHASLLLWALVCTFAACTQVLKGFRWLLLLIIVCVVPLQSYEGFFSTFVWYELLFSIPAPRIPGEEIADVCCTGEKQEELMLWVDFCTG